MRLILDVKLVASCGIVYRDLAPANALLRSDGGVMLMNFGQSRIRGGGITPVSRARLARLSYGAPEMFGGDYFFSKRLLLSGCVESRYRYRVPPNGPEFAHGCDHDQRTSEKE